MHFKLHSATLAFLLLITPMLVLNLNAAQPLFDFEGGSLNSTLPYRKRGVTTLGQAHEYATSGKASLCFASKKWQKGRDEWPSFELKPTHKDWRDFDRLVVDITNPNGSDYLFNLFITDSQVKFQQGARYSFELPAHGHKRFEIPLHILPSKLKRSDISLLHFFTERPSSDFTLYLDNITLLKKGETLPDPGPDFISEISLLALPALKAAESELAALKESFKPYCITPAISDTAVSKVDSLDKSLDYLRRNLHSNTLSLAELTKLQHQMQSLPNAAARILSLIKLQHDAHKAGLPSDPMIVAVATPMEHVMPRGAPFHCQALRSVEMRLARNEWESVQIIVMPATKTLKDVSVSVSDLAGPARSTLSASHFTCDLTGYVETKSKPPYKVSHVGWWPDPILNFINQTDINTDDLQSFWLRLHAPADQMPGTYHGKITVTAANAPKITLNLQVRINNFTLPTPPHLPMAITFAPHDSPLHSTQAIQKEWRNSDDYPVNAWKKHKLAWAEMLADYGITYDSLYHSAMPDFEVLTHLKKQGRLGMFNLGYWFYHDDTPEAAQRWETRTLQRLKAAYDGAKEHGLLDHAYIYGCDEISSNYFERIEIVAARIKAACPGVPIMTTSYDYTHGVGSPLKSIDIFCPHTPRFKTEQVAKSREINRDVWWYICCDPHPPYANMFVESPAIEGRILMGAMTTRMRPGGFLYYQISIWNSEKPITSGPFTTWDPRSWTRYHGDGSWTCVGPDGKPLPTQRLENFRDGLEDFAYVKLLEQLIAERQPESDSPWLISAKSALEVPESLMQNMRDYSRDPQELLQWRNSIADLIESAPPAMEPLLQ